MTLDHWVARLLAPLAFWVLLNGIDDLIIDIAGLFSVIRDKRAPTEEELDAAPPRRTAIFVALWNEHKVIQRMIDNNVTKLRYPHVDFFIGVYPNDAPTIASVREAMKRHPTVHLSMCPHHGPTSKADNLNWIYQRMLVHEEQHGVRFEMILTHDAEDLMDPDALRWINYYAQWNDMVQIPVLALPTPLRELAHGVYCDEFAEFQFKDMPARQTLGGFIPSNGVGTGFSRRALEMIAEAHSNRIFEPACLTEDYENGFRIKRLGLPQYFIPIHFRQGRPIATREYFPRKFLMAVRQRTRWTTGIGLQSWEFHSARETFEHLYWFWRDRKSIIGNLIAPMTNILTILGGVTWVEAEATHTAWGLAQDLSRFYPLYVAGLTMQALQTAIRIRCSAKVYGSRFAAGVPVRVLTANIINCVATLRAICMYANAKLHQRPLRWVKTEHAYPKRSALQTERKPLGEILAESHGLTTGQVEDAAATQPAGVRLGEHLVRLGLIGEEDLYSALSRQNSVPLGMPDEGTVSLPVTRALPVALARKLRVLPFRIAAGELYLAGPDLPGEDVHKDIRRFSSLDIRFHLVTPAEFEELADRYLVSDTNLTQPGQSPDCKRVESVS
jgi:bacteriophage N4 adsorption protein B